jgi:hypothetical protein
MDTLDCADASQLTPARNVSMTALQALAMLNNQFMVRHSEHLAARVASAGDVAKQVAAAYEVIYQREPSAEELKDVTAYATKHGMANACRVLLNSNEFMFVN